MDQSRISFAELVALLEAIFLRFGTSRQTAAILADNCARCERDGAKSHGIFRMKGYTDSLATGWVDGMAVSCAPMLKTDLRSRPWHWRAKTLSKRPAPTELPCSLSGTPTI